MTLILEEELHLANRIRATLPSPFPPLFCGWSLSIYLNWDSQASYCGGLQRSGLCHPEPHLAVCGVGSLFIPDQLNSTDRETMEVLGFL